MTMNAISDRTHRSQQLTPKPHIAHIAFCKPYDLTFLAGALTVSSAVFSSVFTSSAASSVESSARPFLKLLMPLATSPIKSDTLPLPPNTTSTTTSKSTQCHHEPKPITKLLKPSCSIYHALSQKAFAPATNATHPVKCCLGQAL